MSSYEVTIQSLITQTIIVKADSKAAALELAQEDSAFGLMGASAEHGITDLDIVKCQVIELETIKDKICQIQLYKIKYN